jgi:hypothetical protein
MICQRHLSSSELALVLHMLRETPDPQRFLAQLPTIKVEQMDDGGMGSLRFTSPNHNRKLGEVIAEIQYQDEDGVPVLVSLNLDEEGALYELDSWKVDFSPLKRIPKF